MNFDIAKFLGTKVGQAAAKEMEADAQRARATHVEAIESLRADQDKELTALHRTLAEQRKEQEAARVAYEQTRDTCLQTERAIVGVDARFSTTIRQHERALLDTASLLIDAAIVEFRDMGFETRNSAAITFDNHARVTYRNHPSVEVRAAVITAAIGELRAMHLLLMTDEQVSSRILQLRDNFPPVVMTAIPDAERPKFYVRPAFEQA